MKYVGIDLGTTNSAICSFDGEKIHLYKSPEQHDVTPSAIFIDRRGNKYVGSRAYNSAVYLTAGAGSTTFAGGDRFTVTLGAGARVLLTDWLAVHLDIRDHILEVDVVGTNKQTHNFEAVVSLTAFF